MKFYHNIELLKINCFTLKQFNMLKLKVYSFEKLEVWKEARKLAVKIYKLTAKYPPEEKFGLVSQMRRSVNSINYNISEGSSRESFKDQARFTQISFGSLMELLNDSILSFDLQYISDTELLDLRLDTDSIGYKLDSLHKSQLARHKAKIRSKAQKKNHE